MYNNLNGDYNVAIGSHAGNAVTTGSHNVYVGRHAGYVSTTGAQNTAVGQVAGAAITTGHQNTLIGDNAGTAVTTSNNNTCVGHYAGGVVTTGANNLLLGVSSGTSSSPSGAITTGSDTVCLGNNSISDLFCADTSISSSDARDKTDVEDFKHGLSWITELRPVTYRWDKRCWYEDEDGNWGTPDGSKKRDRIHIGFLAQEAIEVEKKHGYASKKDDMLIFNQDEDENDPSYGMKYERLVPVLVNAIKELSAKVDELESNSGGTSSSSSSSAVEELKSLIKDSTSFAKLKSSL